MQRPAHLPREGKHCASGIKSETNPLPGYLLDVSNNINSRSRSVFCLFLPLFAIERDIFVSSQACGERKTDHQWVRYSFLQSTGEASVALED